MDKLGAILDNTTEGERLWVKSFAELNSTTVEKRGAVLSSESGKIMRLSDYLMSGKNMSEISGISIEDIDPEKLDEIYVLIPEGIDGQYVSDDEVAILINVGRSDLLKSPEDTQYIDIGVISRDEVTQDKKFELDEKIKKDIASVEKGALDPKTRENEVEINSLETLVERLLEGKNICPKNKEEIIARAKESGGTVNLEKLEQQTEEEVKDEKNGIKILSSVPEKDMIEAYLTSKGISLGDVKQVTLIRSAESLAENYNQNSHLDLSPGAAPVIAVSLKNREANSRGDRIILFQGNKVNDERINDSVVADFKQKHGKDTNVIEKTYPEENLIKFKEDSENPDQMLVKGVEKPKIENIQAKINEIEDELKIKIKEVTENEDLTKVEKKERIAELTGNAYAQVVKLEETYGVDLSAVAERYFDQAYEASKDESKEKVAEDVKGFVSTMSGGLLFGDEDNERQHLTPAEEAMRKRGF